MKIQIIFGLALVSLITVACAQQSSKSQAEIINATAPEFKEMYSSGGGLLIDIRTPAEYQQGHIAGSTLIDFYAKDYKENLAKLDTTKTVFLYCRSGNRTSKSLGLLSDLGFNKIVNLKNGIIDWQRNNYPLTTE